MDQNLGPLTPIESKIEPAEFSYEIEYTLWLTFFASGKAYGGPEEGGWYFNFGTAIAQFPLLVIGKIPARLISPKDFDPDWEEGCPLTVSRSTQVREALPAAWAEIEARAEQLRPYVLQCCPEDWGDPSSSQGGCELTWKICDSFGVHQFPEFRPQYS